MQSQIIYRVVVFSILSTKGMFCIWASGVSQFVKSVFVCFFLPLSSLMSLSERSFELSQFIIQAN